MPSGIASLPRRQLPIARSAGASDQHSLLNAGRWMLHVQRDTCNHRAARLSDLAALPGNRLEALKGNRAGQHSIRINDRYRVCFVWREKDAYDVEVVDYH